MCLSQKRFAHRSNFRAKQHLEEVDHSSALESFYQSMFILDRESLTNGNFNDSSTNDVPEVDFHNVIVHLDDSYRNLDNIITNR